MTFYLKYRSETVDELDLKEVRESLANMIRSGKIPHALLFSGPKGSGKTSAARILAKVVNCEKPGKNGEPCNKCGNCLTIGKGDNLDVIEIDAASHRGIDDVRVLRDAVKLSPAGAKKKVYIIDEAHMLTTEASNALLKTLEEPPEHVIFILATTNPEKLIETIKSRTVNVSFSKAKDDEIVRSLVRVSGGERLKVGEDVLRMIASVSDGSFRDAVKIFEELVVAGVKMESRDVEEHLFSKKAFDVDKFIVILSKGDEVSAYREIEKAAESGASFKNITTSVLERLRTILLSKVGVTADEDEGLFSKEEVLELIRLISRSYSEAGYAVLEQIPLELAVSEWFSKSTKTSGIKTESGGSLREGDKKAKNPSPDNPAFRKKEAVDVVDMRQNNQSASLENGLDDEVWSRILTEIKPVNASTEALLRASKPVGYDGKTLTLGVYYKFHKEKLETNFHRNLLESALQNVTGDNIRVVCTLTEPPLKNTHSNSSSSPTSESETVVLVESEAVLGGEEDEEIVKAAKEIFGD